jgi:hypothetical protein
MPVSGTFDFNMTIDQIIRKAAQRAGGGSLNGEELKDALLSLNLVFLDMVNNAVPLALIEQFDISLSSGVQDYLLNSSVSDLHHVVINKVGSDSNLSINRRSMADFNSISDLSTIGRPTTYTTERKYNCINLRVWPVPDDSYTLLTYAFVKPADAKRYTENMQIQPRYLPTIIAGLAAEIAADRQRPEVDNLRMDYNRKLTNAQKEDRERVNYRISPELNTR